MRQKSINPLLIAVGLLLLSQVHAFPKIYSQCDITWANEVIRNGSGETICIGGKQLVALSMILGGCQMALNGAPSTPSALNLWLE
jgi:hypothetical protein